MPFHLRFLDGGIVTIDKDKLDNIDIVRAVGEYTAEPEKGYLGSFKDQIVVCREENENNSLNILNILIKSIFEIPYVNGFDVSQYYLKNDDAIYLHPDKVIWINDRSNHCYEIIRWNSEKNISTSTVTFLRKEELEEMYYSSESLSPISKNRLFYLINI